MLRVGTFNIENLDTAKDEKSPALEERAPVLRSVLNRMNANILCLQEVHSQSQPEKSSEGQSIRTLAALDCVLKGTKYEQFGRAYTKTQEQTLYAKRNLVILVDPHLCRSASLEIKQYKQTAIIKPEYRKVTEVKKDKNGSDNIEITWERPILHAQIKNGNETLLDILNLHLKSRIASNIAGQKVNHYSWNSAAGWAEGYFVSSVKRVGQALETRVVLDMIFEKDPNAKVLVCGDFNAEPGEVPLEAICGRTENTNNPLLRKGVMVPCSSAIAESVRFTHYHHGKGNLLDHILVSQSLLPHFRTAQIYNENLHDESLPFAFESKYPESDHAAFVAEFDLTFCAR